MNCTHPRTVRNPNTRKWMDVPCGHCIACRIAKTKEWTIRLMMENDCWKESCFLTLTYDDDHLPMTPCGHMTLWPDHMQKFWKNARIKLHRYKMKHDADYRFDYETYQDMKWMDEKFRIPSPPLLKYFMAGEYGDGKLDSKGNSVNCRPHYHAIVFGTQFKEKGDWWIHHYKSNGDPVYTSNALIDLWPYGLATVDFVVPERCGYVAGYVQKKLYYNPLDYFKEYGCSVYPFQRQSQGLGLNYYNDHQYDMWTLKNFRPRLKGRSYCMPRYFVKHDEVLRKQLLCKAKKIVHEELEKKFSFSSGSDYYESLRVREHELKSRSKLHR